MLILGVDPGLAHTGWGVVDYNNTQPRLVAHGCVRTAAAHPTAQRLLAIYQSLRTVISDYRPEVCGIEMLFFQTNVKTAMAVSQARGVAILATAEAALPLQEISPVQIKQAITGSGKADKSQVQMMVRVMLRLQAALPTDHESDSLAIALTAGHLHGFEQRVNKALLSTRRR